MKASVRARKDAEKTERARLGAELAKKTDGPFEHDPGTPGRYYIPGVGWFKGAGQ